MYKSFASLVKFTHNSFILCDAIVNGVIFLISFSGSLLLRNWDWAAAMGQRVGRGAGRRPLDHRWTKSTTQFIVNQLVFKQIIGHRSGLTSVLGASVMWFHSWQIKVFSMCWKLQISESACWEPHLDSDNFHQRSVLCVTWVSEFTVRALKIMQLFV